MPNTSTSPFTSAAPTAPRSRRRRDTSSPPLLRLTQPYVRENGQLRPASWDEALDRATAAFRETVEQRGPQAVGMFSCSKATNEVNFLAQKFVRSVLGTNNIDSCNRT
jgi:predicted molibdopterin-dependent oxidoreductase YjgC